MDRGEVFHRNRDLSEGCAAHADPLLGLLDEFAVEDLPGGQEKPRIILFRRPKRGEVDLDNLGQADLLRALRRCCDHRRRLASPDGNGGEGKNAGLRRRNCPLVRRGEPDAGKENRQNKDVEPSHGKSL